MILSKLKTKLAKDSLGISSPKKYLSFIKQINIIYLLFITFLIIFILSIISDKPKDLINKVLNNDDVMTTPIIKSIGIDIGEINPTPRELDWIVNIPNNYNLKKEDSFETDEFAIFYENASKTYYINIYKGEDYTFEEIKQFIRSKVITRFPDFDEYDDRKFPDSLITYYDYRGIVKEKLDLKTFKVNP